MDKVVRGDIRDVIAVLLPFPLSARRDWEGLLFLRCICMVVHARFQRLLGIFPDLVNPRMQEEKAAVCPQQNKP